ncbi:bifunctional 2-polyprenyl-6-hydroxyphenol methylase/3-demethylubiquinol 3-O-methyltransferase UbiG [Halobacillus sp. A5]|uniref:class I SAM-dependent methyltransferase n=1 Tax=Halobacillus sp. A5 TaxID=2880263 RepID=UPI0020A6D2BC|nr:class I SAM-dependent methyltransferase [Halobacillus sp. A5]MCP3028701.1 class I SAM-dependent methyltransferase [Halobacillus sp. A5]
MITQEKYWDERFKEGEIWGDSPCPSVDMSLPHFRDRHMHSILVPGCGYGRNSFELAKKGFKVKGIDVSSEAIKLACRNISAEIKNIEYKVEDILNPNVTSGNFDAIYLSNVLHLFLKDQRTLLMNHMNEQLKPGGLMIFTCISTEDHKNYGVGEEIEENTFLHNDKSLHFYNEKEIARELPPNFNVLERTLHNQTETDPAGNKEVLVLWFVAAKKVS